MNYFLLFEIIKYIKDSNKLSCLSLDKYYNNYSQHYLYKKSIIYIQINNFKTYSHLNVNFHIYDNAFFIIKEIPSGYNIYALTINRENIRYLQSIPNCVKKIYIDQKRRRNIAFNAGVMPNNYNYYEHFFNILPKSLDTLHMDNGYNAIFQILPPKLRKLKLGHSFNQPLNNLPKSLKILELGNYFNCSLDNLPHSLKVLSVGCHFDKPLNNLPKSLKKLTTGNSFNRSINRLPHTLKYLVLGDSFNHNIDILPHNLKYLRLTTSCIANITIVCDSLEILDLRGSLSHITINKLPNSLKKIICNKYHKYINHYYRPNIKIYNV